MQAVELIRKKRDGGVLLPDEIRFLIEGFVHGVVPDYQMAAFLMAVFFQGMNDEELFSLTRAMIESGDELDLSSIPGIVVDKHSTGGVGDKTTLVLVPLVAAAGAPVMKMSGRGLGFTGGTIDKLESFSGLRTEFTLSEMIGLVREHGACIGAQTGNLTPADKKLYALRDVTGTVESIPLIAASVMSKKLAAGAQGLVLDVKCGRGAFARTFSEAQRLAEVMVTLAKSAGRKAVALITSMDQPLGRAVGNALEVKEAIATLKGEGPEDLVRLVLTLGAEMLVLAGVSSTVDEAERTLQSVLESGAGLVKFQEIIEAQGGDPRAVDDPGLLPAAPFTVEVRAEQGGFIARIDALAVGELTMRLGAGRTVQGERIDLSVGVELAVKVGESVEPGSLLGRIHAPSSTAAQTAAEDLRAAVSISEIPPEPMPLILGRIADS